MADREIELNPLFFVPPGVIDVRQENQSDSQYAYAQDGGSLVAVGPVLQNPDSSIPNAPTQYRIVSQSIRQNANGQTVVDVELEFPNIGAGLDIDVAVTPA